MTREEALVKLVEAQSTLAYAYESYAMALCAEGKPGLASQVASAIGMSRKFHFESLSTLESKAPGFTLVKPCEAYKK